MDKIKDGYLKAIDWIEDHPHRTFWSSLGVVALVGFVAAVAL